MPGRLPARLGGFPRDATALLELDDVILPDGAVPGERHAEHVTDVADALPGDGVGQVAVTVSTRL